MNDRVIHDFWKWFSASACSLTKLVSSGGTNEIVQLVTPQVNRLKSSIRWEIGPGTKTPYAFSFSLNGNIENLSDIKRIIALNPGIEGWEFNAGKPPKQWDGRFLLSNRFGQEVWIESNGWEYILTSFNSGEFFDVSLMADKLEKLDDKGKEQAGSIVVQSALGELMTLKLIDRIVFIDNPEKDELERANSINVLREHIDSLLLDR